MSGGRPARVPEKVGGLFSGLYWVRPCMLVPRPLFHSESSFPPFPIIFLDLVSMVTEGMVRRRRTNRLRGLTSTVPFYLCPKGEGSRSPSCPLPFTSSESPNSPRLRPEPPFPNPVEWVCERGWFFRYTETFQPSLGFHRVQSPFTKVLLTRR